MLKNCKFAVALAFFISIASMGVAHSEDHGPSKITGAQIELFERGHAFAGSILQVPVFGVFTENPFGARVEMRKEGQTLVLNLKRSGNTYGGDIIEIQSSEDPRQPQEKITHVEYLKVEKTGQTEGMITLKMNSDVIPVRVSAATFDRGHFQAPHFEANIGNQKVEFNFSGEACFGYSANLAMMVLGSYYHLSK